MFENYKDFIQRLLKKFPASEIHIIAIKPSPANQSSLEEFITVNSLLQDYSSGMKRVNFHPGPGSDSNSGQGFDESSFKDDGIHLTEQGYQLFLSGVNKACTKT